MVKAIQVVGFLLKSCYYDSQTGRGGIFDFYDISKDLIASVDDN